MMVSSKVPPNAGAVSLDSYLAQRFTYLSEEEWRKRIREGRIFRNGQVAHDSSVIVAKGDSIAYDLPDFKEPPANLDYSIIYEDAWILGVDKPGNLLVHKSGRSLTSNLIYQLRYRHRPVPYPLLNAVNRLDRETSGVVLFAKDNAVLRRMNDALTKRMMQKDYSAVVHGIPKESAWTVKLPIGKDEQSLIHCKFRIDCDKGKYAETRIEKIRPLKGEKALLRVRPITGRTHQIRVHCAACGFPIVGDKLYGVECRHSFDGSDYLPRQALHCASITFEHPVTRKEIVINAPLPAEIKNLLMNLAPRPVFPINLTL